MRMFIPTVGTEFKLSEDWVFDLFHEYRNEKLMEHFKLLERSESGYSVYNSRESTEVTLPKGTIIKIDRIYVKKGNGAYDSVTVYAQIAGEKRKRRFWVKLNDFNQIEAEDI